MSTQEIYQLSDVWKKTSFVLVGLILITLALSACARQGGADPARATDASRSVENGLANTQWRLISFGALGKERPVIAGSTITLEFDSEGQAGGTGGCNSYGARYEVQQNVLSFGELTHTMMACGQEGIGQQEQRFLLALETAGSFDLVKDRLTLWYDDGQGVLNWVTSGL